MQIPKYIDHDCQWIQLGSEKYVVATHPVISLTIFKADSDFDQGIIKSKNSS